MLPASAPTPKADQHERHVSRSDPGVLRAQRADEGEGREDAAHDERARAERRPEISITQRCQLGPHRRGVLARRRPPRRSLTPRRANAAKAFARTRPANVAPRCGDRGAHLLGVVRHAPDPRNHGTGEGERTASSMY
jgi:hypothetical protein